jgi:hypothetical protein
MKRCNSEYSYDLIKGCKYGDDRPATKWNKDRDLIGFFCKCPNKCETCYVGSGRQAVYMHPDLHAQYEASYLCNIRGNVAKGAKDERLEIPRTKCSRCGHKKPADAYKTCQECRDRGKRSRDKDEEKRRELRKKNRVDWKATQKGVTKHEAIL